MLMSHELRSRKMPLFVVVVTLVAAIGVGLWTELGRGGA
jgi:hypothetical protein